MAAVLPPVVTYRPHLDPEIVRCGKLSDIQLERVIYAGQRHEQRRNFRADLSSPYHDGRIPC
jgi:hypothetical protein